MAGVTDLGFEVLRLNDVITNKKQQAVQIFQDLVPVGDIVDTSDSSILGRLINLEAPAETDLWEAAALAYSSYDPEEATGNALDNICAIGGVSRLGSLASTAQVQLLGNINASVDTAFQLSSPSNGKTWLSSTNVTLDNNGINYFSVSVLTVANNTAYTISLTPNIAGAIAVQYTYTSDSSATALEILNGLVSAINTSGRFTATLMNNQYISCTANDPFSQTSVTLTSNLGFIKSGKVGMFTCTEVGAITAPAKAISSIDTPVLGIDSATNLLDATVGRLVETDDELRTRFRVSKAERATNTIESIYTAVRSVNGVSQLTIYENDTSTTDSNGIPPHSFMPVVVGGSTSLIGQAIWSKKPIGIQSVGDTYVTVNDIQGLPHIIAFKRPAPVKIYVTVNIKKDSTFPATGVTDIQTALINYLQAFAVDQDVIYSRLYTPVNTVKGFYVDSLFAGTSASPTGTANIPISNIQIAYADTSSVIVNVLP